MEAYTMFMNWNNQHDLNVHTIQSIQQIQCNPYKNTNDTFQRFTTTISKIYMEPEMTPNSLSNLKKEEEIRRDHNSWYQTLLQGNCNQNNLVVA